MIRILFIFLIILGSVWLGVFLKQDPGYILVAIHHWTFETTFLVGTASIMIAFALLHGLLLLIHWFTHLPTSWQGWLARRRIRKAQATTRKGLIEFSEGHWLAAKNHLIKALPDTDAPLLNYLTAARAAQEMGDNKLRDDYLRQAQQSMPEAKIAVELTQAQLQLANQQWEQALATLRHLQDLAPRHPYVLKLLMHLYQEVKDWRQLISLLPELKQHRVISAQEFLTLQQHAYLQAMLDLIKLDQEDPLTDLVNQLPKNLVYDVELLSAYSGYLLTKNKDTNVELLLRKALTKQFDDQWIELYGQTKTKEDQLAFAESFIKKQPRSAALFLCLGRLSRAHQLWGKAKKYFEQSLEFNKTPAAYLELGTLLEQLNDPTGACLAYREGLLLHR